MPPLDRRIALIFLFVGVFLLLMIALAALSSEDRLNQANQSEEQIVQNPQDEQIIGVQKPFILGLSGFYMLLLVVLILAGIGFFIKILFGRRR